MRYREGIQSTSSTLGKLALAGAVALLAAPALKRLSQRWALTHPQASKENAIDESLKNTYPASDPPASRYVDIPINRR